MQYGQVQDRRSHLDLEGTRPLQEKPSEKVITCSQKVVSATAKILLGSAAKGLSNGAAIGAIAYTTGYIINKVSEGTDPLSSIDFDLPMMLGEMFFGLGFAYGGVTGLCRSIVRCGQYQVPIMNFLREII